MQDPIASSSASWAPSSADPAGFEVASGFRVPEGFRVGSESDDSTNPTAPQELSQDTPLDTSHATPLDTSHATPHREPPQRLRDLLLGLSETASSENGSVEASLSATDDQVETQRFENHLAMVRLGMATSLFYALRAKHSPTAAHSLRVALACSAWCLRLGLAGEDRDRIEVAALLHDIGKIGIPDRILRKPARLSVDEQLTMECCTGLACEILKGCTTDNELLEIVRHSNQWFNSRRDEDSIRGDQLPIGARMLAIAVAFDSMTTDQVYRSAMSRERALQELLRGAGTQFDPELTRDFFAMLEHRPELLHRRVVHRWLQHLDGSENVFLDGLPTIRTASTSGADSPSEALPGESTAHPIAGPAPRFYQHYQTLARESCDGFAFTDGEGQVLFWNEALSRLTGVTADAIIGRQWDSATLGLFEPDQIIGEASAACPIMECLRSQGVVAKPMRLRFNDELREVFLQVSPVQSARGNGTVLTLRDVSGEAAMQSQIESLHIRATSDPLTGIANRAELDRRLCEATQAAKDTGQTFSLIICDIDHFKSVNDVHGHPAGDEALIEFANVMQNHARANDLVARYGGEEFVLLATTSDNATAARRAEEIRRAISVTPLDGLGGQCITASFGVTEFQTGDSADTVLARADRALLQAKENGRDRVVQLGSGIATNESVEETAGWFQWWSTSKPSQDHEFILTTPVPIELAIEKLRGFIADHRAEIILVNEKQVSLRLTTPGQGGRRAADTQFTLHLMITLNEGLDARGKGNTRGRIKQTQITVLIQPTRNRDRRNRELEPCIKEMLGSLKSYLMAELVTPGE